MTTHPQPPQSPQSFDSWWPYDPIQLEGDDEDAATTKDIAESAWDAGMAAGRNASAAMIEHLEVGVEAGKELYWAIQGGLEHCPWCTSGSVRHHSDCPVHKYLMATMDTLYREAERNG